MQESFDPSTAPLYPPGEQLRRDLEQDRARAWNELSNHTRALEAAHQRLGRQAWHIAVLWIMVVGLIAAAIF